MLTKPQRQLLDKVAASARLATTIAMREEMLSAFLMEMLFDPERNAGPLIEQPAIALAAGRTREPAEPLVRRGLGGEVRSPDDDRYEAFEPRDTEDTDAE
jgi:hypothetical protein